MNIYLKFKLHTVAIVISMSVVVTACTDHFDSLNTPAHTIATENLDEGTLGQLFAQSQYNAPHAGWFQVWYNLMGDSWSQYVSQLHVQFLTDQYDIPGDWNSATYDRFHDNVTQLNYVIRYTQENDLKLENAISKVQNILLFLPFTDLRGPIIYSEFGNGETSVGYDSQEDVYKSFFEELDEAVQVLAERSGDTAFADHDMIYGGSAAQWLVFANSLRLRLAMRLSYVDEELSRQEAEKAMLAPGGVMLDNSDSALLTNTTDSPYYYSNLTFHMEWGMSSTMESILVGYDDPRLPVYFQQCCDRLGDDHNSEVWSGFRSGLPIEERGFHLRDTNSYIGRRYMRVTDGGENPPTAFMEASEVFFLRAEGALRGYEHMGGTPEELYNLGIRASIEYKTDATDSEINQYITSSNTPIPLDDEWNSPAVADIPVVYQSGGDFETQLEQIITQKWIAGFPDNGHNSYAERRRTGYPIGYALVYSGNEHLSETDLIRRLTFTDTESVNNVAAVEAAKDLLNGPDNNATRVWWDAKPLSDYPVPRGAVN